MNSTEAKSPNPSRTAIITGGNSGLGSACAQALLEDASGTSPWHVILACRDPMRARAANHLGHFPLVNLLRPRLTPPARVVVVSSGTHDPALKTGVPAPAWNDPMALAKGELGPLAAKDAPTKRGQRSYSTSKLANVFFSYELARRLPAGVTVNAFDPDLMPGTGLVREGSAPLRFLWHLVLPRILPLLRRFISPDIHTPAESGAALARLVSDPALEGTNGKHFEGRREVRSSTESYDGVRAKELWQASAVLTCVDAPLA